MNARERLERSVRQAPPAATLSRVGLGAVILLAGAHELVDPAVWTGYLAPAFARRWPVSVEPTMVAFGLSELPVGLALLVDRHTALAAAVVAVSTLGVLVDLAILLAQTGRGGDVLVRDLAVLTLATAVAVRALGTRTADTESGDGTGVA